VHICACVARWTTRDPAHTTADQWDAAKFHPGHQQRRGVSLGHEAMILDPLGGASCVSPQRGLHRVAPESRQFTVPGYAILLLTPKNFLCTSGRDGVWDQGHGRAMAADTGG